MDFSFNNHEYNYFLSEKMIREILHEHLNKNEINSLTCSICLENIFLNNIEENINSSNLNNTTLTDNKIEVIENEYTDDNEGYKRLLLKSGGADSPRPVMLRLAKDGNYYIWSDSFLGLLADIKKIESANPWA